jgi:hypothetical protein
MNIFPTFYSKGVKEDIPMKEMIVIKALAGGFWEIQVVMKKSKNELIERGKVCKI